MPDKLFLQNATCLNEKAFVDRLMRRVHALSGRIVTLEPAADLLRRPPQRQFTRDHLPQPSMAGKQTPLGPLSGYPGLIVRMIGSVSVPPPVPWDLATDSGS